MLHSQWDATVSKKRSYWLFPMKVTELDLLWIIPNTPKRKEVKIVGKKKKNVKE